MIGARETCKEMLKPGTAVADLYRTYVKYLRDRDIEPTLKFLGHGIGQTIHEEPYITDTRTVVLEPEHHLHDGAALHDPRPHGLPRRGHVPDHADRLRGRSPARSRPTTSSFRSADGGRSHHGKQVGTPPMTVRVGVAFDGFVSTGEAIELAERAVAAGAHSLWVAEHLGYREAIATCMAFALKAPGPLLVPTAVSPYLWHPTPTAMAMATLDEVAPGRVAIAVGTGNPLFLQESGHARREAGARQSRVHRGAAPALGRRSRAHGRRFREARRRAARVQAERADPGLYRRDGARHAAAGGPHRRRRRALRRPVDRLGEAVARAVRRGRRQGQDAT